MKPVALQHVEATTGPVAVGGRTISLVARTTTVTFGRSAREIAVWSRPHHVEILDRGGQREVVRVRDAQVIGAVFAEPVTAGDQVSITATACLATANRQRRRTVARIEVDPDCVRVRNVVDVKRLALATAAAVVAMRVVLARALR